MSKHSKKPAGATNDKSVGITLDGIRVLKPKTKPTEFTTAEIRSTIAKVRHDMGIVNDHLFVERRDDGNFAVRRSNAARASGVFSTQREAIARAKELAPGKTPIIERVRRSTANVSDKWRKA